MPNVREIACDPKPAPCRFAAGPERDRGAGGFCAMQDFAAIIRRAIKKSGKSQYALAKETGVSQGRISEFMAGNDLRLAHASKLAAAVGLKLSAQP